MPDNPPGFEELRQRIVDAIEEYLDGVTRWACLGGQVEEVERRHELGRAALVSLLSQLLRDLRHWSSSPDKARGLMQKVQEWIAASTRNLDLFLEGTLQEADPARRRETAIEIARRLRLSEEDTELLVDVIEEGMRKTFSGGQGSPPPDGCPF